MKVKNLKELENLPEKASMRKSSGYDSWESYKHYGRGLYAWTKGFVKKHIGESLDSVYSLYKKSLAEKHINKGYQDEMIWFFQSIVNYPQNRPSYWFGADTAYVDDDGILRSIPKKAKNRDITINYGEPTYSYVIKQRYKNNKRLFKEIYGAFIGTVGYLKTQRMIEQGISMKEYCSIERYRFNNICYNRGIKDIWYPYKALSWDDVWERKVTYPQSVTYKYGTPEYYRYVYESMDSRKKELRESKKRKIEEFNKRELVVNEQPILIE